jgi:acetylornithine deacetylase/succinyl-diaminopimelate desuccinylase-like protein
MPLDPVETLQKLIQTPSVNPMGRDVSGPIYGEGRMTALLEKICRDQGWPCTTQRVDEGRFNLLAYALGSPLPQFGGELILWDVHQDTVPVDGMTVEPFGGKVRDGRVYGRGACDVKGAMAAMLAGLSRVEATDSVRRPTILLACTVNEECGFTGAKLLVSGWDNEEREYKHVTKPLVWTRPHLAIVAEPTQFDVVVAHQGSVRWRCHTLGRSAHTSRPDQGINAIYAMAEIVRTIEEYHAELGRSAPNHPLCGRPSVCVSTIHGGVGINTVPEHVTIEIDRRLGPEERPEMAYKELVQLITEQSNVGKCRVEHDLPFMDSGGLSDKNNRELAERIANLVRANGRPSEIVGVPYGTDASIISATGVPTVVFGPGSIAQAHTCDEFIEIDQLAFAADVFHRIASGALEIN